MTRNRRPGSYPRLRRLVAVRASVRGNGSGNAARAQRAASRTVARDVARTRSVGRVNRPWSPTRRVLVTMLVATCTMLVTLSAVGATAVWGAWNYYSEDLPDLSDFEVREFATTRIYDRNGTLIYEVNDPETGYRTWLNYDQLTADGANTWLVDATISAEDETFWTNWGVEPAAIVRGALINLGGEGSSGGSTVTQQLVRLLYPENIGNERSLDRKIREAIVAVQFTREYSKKEIVELYLNSIFYGNRAYGIEAAARTYFNKLPADLTLAEASLLAGLPQAPSYYDPLTNMEAAKGRQRYVLDRMVQDGHITQQQADDAWLEVLAPQEVLPRENAAPHWVNFVIAWLEQRYGAEAVYRGGLNVVTTLDLNLQREAEAAVTEHLDTLSLYDAGNGAAVAMLPDTGEIVAMVGSRDYDDDSIAGQVNVTLSDRQPGSAFMPITYAAAFEAGWTPETKLLDYGQVWETPGAPEPTYAPQNADGQFHGAVSVREALGASLNIPAVQAIDFAGVPNTIDLAHRVGVREGLWRGENFYGLALTLGGGEVSLLELTNAYATFANNGEFAGWTPVLEVRSASGDLLYETNRGQTSGSRVMYPEHAWEINDILSDPAPRRATFGPDSPLEFPELPEWQIAAKTGTSADWRDNWTIAYSPALVVGIWVGNTDNQPMRELDGIAGAAPIAHRLLVSAHQSEFAPLLALPDGSAPATTFPRPDGVQLVDVCTATGGLPVEGLPSTSAWIATRDAPMLRCDQLTTDGAAQLRAALTHFADHALLYTPAGAQALLDYAQAVGGGVGVPDNPLEPTPTPTPTQTPTPTATPTQTPRATPTVTPTSPSTATGTVTGTPSRTVVIGETPTGTVVVGPPAPTATVEPQTGPSVIPNVVGMSLDAAIATLTSSGFRIGQVVSITQTPIPAGVDVGEVQVQSVTPGIQAPPGTAVSLGLRAQ